jgi:Fe-S oxidoreductase
MLVDTRQITQTIDLYRCIQCGKCTGGCPLASINQFNLRGLIYNLLVEDRYELENEEALWDCTTCFTCSTRCPKDVHPADAIIALRGLLVEEGRVPRSLAQALTSTYRNNNPFEMSAANRADWANDLSLKNALDEPVEVCYFAGCMPSFEPRLQKVARALTGVLLAAGVDLGTMGAQEPCCGSEVRRIGEQGLFEMMVEESTGELLAALQAGQMITTSPHCFDTFNHYYPSPGFPILHYSMFVAEKVKEGSLAFSTPLPKKVTYHDPCYLGRQNKVFDEPRAILQAIPGLDLVEMDRSRETSLCCGGGGGRMWFEGTTGERLANSRIEEALDTGAEILATACPFCLMMLGDAAVAMNAGIEVKDLIELAAEAL